MSEQESLAQVISRANTLIQTLKNQQIARRSDFVTTQSTLRTKEIQSDVDRLGGKIEGIEVIVGYLQEELRAHS